MRVSRSTLIATAMLIGVATAATAASVDPLFLVKQGTAPELALQWTVDPVAFGYAIRRVSDPALVPVIAMEPIYITVPFAAPAFPVLDPGALGDPTPLWLYDVESILTCISGFDDDGDRLDNCVETDSGVFVDASDTGTDPGLSDTDDDGIDDGDEVLGTVTGLDLPGLGAKALRQTIFIEYDWFEHDLGGSCGMHSHRPTVAIADRVAAFFAAAPTLNPDGSTGVDFIQDYGQGAPFTGGNFIDDADGDITGGVTGPDFQFMKDTHHDPRRIRYFHYTILPHRYTDFSGSSGQAELWGNDMIVSLTTCPTSSSFTRNVANTIAHELGHNLGLHHGGNEACNRKPNYNSVLNYNYQFPGEVTDCVPPGDGPTAYSTGLLPPLDENAIDENAGMCGAVPVDWNGDSSYDNPIVFDLNRSSPTGTPDNSSCGGTLTVLNDYDDWGNMSLRSVDSADFTTAVVDCDNPAPE